MRCTAWLLWRIHLTFRQMASRQGMGAYLALVLIKNMPQARPYHSPHHHTFQEHPDNVTWHGTSGGVSLHAGTGLRSVDT